MTLLDAMLGVRNEALHPVVLADVGGRDKFKAHAISVTESASEQRSNDHDAILQFRAFMTVLRGCPYYGRGGRIEPG